MCVYTADRTHARTVAEPHSASNLALRRQALFLKLDLDDWPLQQYSSALRPDFLLFVTSQTFLYPVAPVV